MSYLNKKVAVVTPEMQKRSAFTQKLERFYRRDYDRIYKKTIDKYYKGEFGRVGLFMLPMSSADFKRYADLKTEGKNPIVVPSFNYFAIKRYIASFGRKAVPTFEKDYMKTTYGLSGVGQYTSTDPIGFSIGLMLGLGFLLMMAVTSTKPVTEKR